MSTIFAALLFLLGTAGAVASFIYIRKQKWSGTKSRSVVVVGIICCLLAVLSACYLAATLLLLGGIN